MWQGERKSLIDFRRILLFLLMDIIFIGPSNTMLVTDIEQIQLYIDIDTSRCIYIYIYTMATTVKSLTSYFNYI